MLTGNKGEWSEAYTLLRLLAMGRLYAADENLNKMDNMFFPVLKIYREEHEGATFEYTLADGEKIDIFFNDTLLKSIQRQQFTAEADYLFNRILEGTDRAFAIDRTERFLAEIGCHKLAASSADKTDIRMKLHDVQTGYNSDYGFSIKSEVGSAPTLINAGKPTNFIYKITGLTSGDVAIINAINTPKKIQDRMAYLFSHAQEVVFQKLYSDTFANNLMLLDSLMPQLLSCAILYHYRDGISGCKEIVDKLEEENPLHFPRRGYYEYKFKKFLTAAALGMMPATNWDGIDEANGGYIIVTREGSVLAYHIYNRAFFEEYLLQNTKFERASTTRHDYAHVYEAERDMLINLNLQIRFK